MLSKHDSIQRDQLEMITLDQLVPPNHLVRKMEAAIDFTFIYDLVKGMYSEVGCLQDEINQGLDKLWKEAFSTWKI